MQNPFTLDSGVIQIPQDDDIGSAKDNTKDVDETVRDHMANLDTDEIDSTAMKDAGNAKPLNSTTKETDENLRAIYNMYMCRKRAKQASMKALWSKLLIKRLFMRDNREEFKSRMRERSTGRGEAAKKASREALVGDNNETKVNYFNELSTLLTIRDSNKTTSNHTNKQTVEGSNINLAATSTMVWKLPNSIVIGSRTMAESQNEPNYSKLRSDKNVLKSIKEIASLKGTPEKKRNPKSQRKLTNKGAVTLRLEGLNRPMNDMSSTKLEIEKSTGNMVSLDLTKFQLDDISGSMTEDSPGGQRVIDSDEYTDIIDYRSVFGACGQSHDCNY